MAMIRDFEITNENEIMDVFNNKEKEKIAKVINDLGTLDLSGVSNETKEKIIELFKANALPIERLFANYRCAIMEVETKFKVLNEEFSLIYDGNPIENDIYKLADCFLRQDDITLIKMKDYIKNPKPSGYRSLHLIVAVPIFLENEKKLVKVEVQLRTIAMDFWASLEHKLRYNKKIAPEMLESLSRELNDCATESAELDFRMQNVKNNFLGKDRPRRT